MSDVVVSAHRGRFHSSLAYSRPTVACFVVALLLAVSRALHQGEFSDEQLFLGGAGLMARGQGAIYRDFFYNHMPTHALVLAGLFRLTDYWLLTARLLDAVSAAALATLIFEATRRAASRVSAAWRIALAAGVAGLFLFNPITAEVVGKAWNHNFAAVSCVLGYLLLVHGLATSGDSPTRAGRWAFVSGALGAIGATSRLTFLPPLVGPVLLLLLAPGRDLRGRLRLLGAWTIGALLAASPSIYLILRAPFAAHFGNVRFPEYTAIYHAKATDERRMLLSTKFEYAWQILSESPAMPIVLALTLVAILVAFRPWRLTFRQTAFVGVVAMFAAASVSAFMPTPMFRQYLYGPLPFAVLLIGWAVPHVRVGSRQWPAAAAFLLIAAVAIGASVGRYRSVVVYASSPSTWTPIQVHADATWARTLTRPRARVLTLAPGTALEGRLRIYPKLSIGRYGLRVGDMLTPGSRQRTRLPNYAEIDGWFTSSPPDLVLLVEPQMPDERRLIAIATKHGYWRKYFGKNKLAYFPPTRGATTVPARPATSP